jgi:hypothetical protein
MADLRPAEVKLWKAVVAGAPCEFSRSEPRIIGAAYLRFLLLGGDGDGSAHLNPIDVKGARIEGVLDLDECEAKRSMKAEACRFEGGMMLNDASLRNFGLIGCFVKPIVGVPGLFARPTAIFAERLKASGSVYFRQGSRIFGAVALRHAKIDGSLDLCGSVFSPGTGGRAIDLTCACTASTAAASPMPARRARRSAGSAPRARSCSTMRRSARISISSAPT